MTTERQERLDLTRRLAERFREDLDQYTTYGQNGVVGPTARRLRDDISEFIDRFDQTFGRPETKP